MLRENVVDISHIRVSGFEKIYVCVWLVALFLILNLTCQFSNSLSFGTKALNFQKKISTFGMNAYLPPKVALLA